MYSSCLNKISIVRTLREGLTDLTYKIHQTFRYFFFIQTVPGWASYYQDCGPGQGKICFLFVFVVIWVNLAQFAYSTMYSLCATNSLCPDSLVSLWVIRHPPSRAEVLPIGNAGVHYFLQGICKTMIASGYSILLWFIQITRVF